MLEMIFMLFIIVGVFALGDICGVATKAKLSSIFVALISMLVLFMTGVIPPNIVDKAGLTQVARWATPVLIFSMGTMIDIQQLIREWRTVATACIAMFVVFVSIILVSPLIGWESALVVIPVLHGGIVSTQIMTDGALTKGLLVPAAVGTIAYAIQKFVGTVPASFFGLKEARIILEKYKNGELAYRKSATTSVEEKSFYTNNKAYFTPFVCFAVAVLGGAFAVWIQTIIGIHNSIIALVLGACAGAFKLVPKNILDHGKASGFINMIVFAAIIPSLAKIKLEDLANLSVSLAIIFVASAIGIYVFMYLLPTWKIIGSRNLAMGVAMGQLLGFPATYLIANEISQAVSENDEEYEVVMSVLAPTYVVSGLATVTTISIITAGIMVQFL